MFPILTTEFYETSSGTSNPWYDKLREELYQFWDKYKTDKAQKMMFKPEVNIANAFNKEHLRNENPGINTIYDDVFLIDKESQADGLNFPDSARELFTKGIDIRLGLTLPSFPYPNDLIEDSKSSGEVDLKPLIERIFKFPFEFEYPLFGGICFPVKITVTEVLNVVHAEYTPSPRKIMDYSKTTVAVIFLAKMEPAEKIAIPTEEEIRAKFSNEPYRRYLLKKRSDSKEIFRLMLALIFHRNMFKVFRWCHDGNLLFMKEHFDRNPEECYKLATKDIIHSFFESTNVFRGKQVMTEDGATTILPSLLKIMQIAGDTRKQPSFRYEAEFGHSSRAYSRNILYGKKQSTKIEVKFCENPELDKPDKSQADLYYKELESIVKYMKDFISNAEAVMKKLERFTGSKAGCNNVFDFFCNEFAEDMCAEPIKFADDGSSHYVDYSLEREITLSLSDLAKEILM
jgi:hypothetical protein